MSVRHIGFSVVNKDGKHIIEENDALAFDEQEVWMESYAKSMDRDVPSNAPHKVVRVLIDDGEAE